MASSFLVVFLFILLSYIPELFLIVSSVPTANKRLFATQSWLGKALHVLFIGLIFLCVFLLTHRPYFAMLVAIGTVCVLVIVSNAKYKTLREPLVFSDIVMFSQAFKHPRLYLPFLGIVPAISAPVIAGLAIFAIFKYEPVFVFSLETWVATATLIALCVVLIQWLALKLKLTQQPATDIKQHGLLASLLGYSIQARAAKHRQKIEAVLLSSSLARKKHQSGEAVSVDKPTLVKSYQEEPNEKTNIVLIQSESFFDARRLHESIDPSILKGFDQFCDESRYHGKLNVPAWGANTMRTEFSVLTGVPSEKLGLYRFYPYQYLSKQTIPSLASYLSDQGYHCVCVHPHPASFFGRDRVFPKLGFDEFIDIESFDKNQTFGPYISDKAVTDKILEILNSNASKNPNNKPLFIFAITMENHGPLHLEKTDDKDVATLYADTPPENHNDLTVYLRHLSNADSMLTDLRVALTKSEEESILCFYGDHVPSMPKIYETVSYEDETADYFIWQSDNRTTGKQYDMDAENLAEHLLESLCVDPINGL